MSDSPRKLSYQNLGNGLYRVGSIRRSAVTGMFTNKKVSTPQVETSEDKEESRNEALITLYELENDC